MPKYVVDTNLYVEAITTDEGNAALAAFQRRCAPFLFQHSTIAQEILAGARSEADFQSTARTGLLRSRISGGSLPLPIWRGRGRRSSWLDWLSADI